LKEDISLEISNYWVSNKYLTETNKKSGTLVAFDWENDYLTGINTNINLGELELKGFEFDTFVNFLNNNNFNFVLGLRNELQDNPNNRWTDKLKENLQSNKIGYDEYMVEIWPAPIPRFNVGDEVFILRYSYDEYSKIDTLASKKILFEKFLKDGDWSKHYKKENSKTKTRVIVLCSDIENLILHESFDK
tara:strand:- start:155 stop:724 length:570 start_codon:yes stop_codon:yes gene_type:complete